MNRSNLILMLAALVASFISTSSPYLLGLAIDHYGEYKKIAFGIIFLAGAGLLVSPLLKLTTVLYVQKISMKTRQRLKEQLINILVRQNMENATNGGQIVDLVDGDVDGALYLLHRVYYDVALNISLIIMSLSIVAYMEPIILLAPVLAIILSFIFYWLIRTKANTLFMKVVAFNTKLVGSICDDIRLRGKINVENHTEAMQKFTKLSVVTQFQSSMMNSFSSSSHIVAIVTLLAIGAWYSTGNRISAGELVSAAIYVERVLAPVGALVAMYFSTREAFVRLNRIKINMSGHCNV
ncbi:ABC transporter transmembrane domain-containing protein [Pseudomonas syringae]|uniref:ABC transporter transmembrane domain-containing protein n=1 Tax=Pseudomonas syringae TaxID=317 RepID=UPI00215A6621|nr:ABC transporter transmembrane domain-containing protein [Pseudomonas syringae]MCR8718754.1 ABC transporter transmembrane domain-containing protein [Pseudomonas syringae]